MEQNNCCMHDAITEYPNRGCGCLGYGYVPVQELTCVYDCNSAIKNGTLFPELDLDICEYGKVCKKWGGTLDD